MFLCILAPRISISKSTAYSTLSCSSIHARAHTHTQNDSARHWIGALPLGRRRAAPHHHRRRSGAESRRRRRRCSEACRNRRGRAVRCGVATATAGGALGNDAAAAAAVEHWTNCQRAASHLGRVSCHFVCCCCCRCYLMLLLSTTVVLVLVRTFVAPREAIIVVRGVLVFFFARAQRCARLFYPISRRQRRG